MQARAIIRVQIIPVPSNTVTGYHAAGVNRDGTVKYTGQDNDRDPILQNIGGVVPTNTRVEQVP